MCVCVCVCLLSHILPLERLFVLKSLPRAQRATEVEIYVGVSLKLLRSRTTAIPALYGCAVSHFLIAEYAHELAIIRAIPAVSAAQAHARI